MITIEQKNIVEEIVNKFKKIISLDSFRVKVDSFLQAEYKKGLEQAELKFNMNFVPNNQALGFLNKYVNDNLENVADELGSNLRAEISRGILNKENIDQLKVRIKKVFSDDKYYNRLKTVIRTERQRALEMGNIDGATQSGLKLKKYLDVILDDRTSDICRAEAKKYPKENAIHIDQDFVVRVNNKTIKGQHPPFHPNCRTVLRFVRLD